MRALISALFALTLAACATEPAAPPAGGDAPAVHLSGTHWRRVDDMNANPHGATLDFEGARATGYTGCNRWFADVTQDGEILRFGPIGTTRMACTAGVQQATERSFLAVLRATRYGHYDQDALMLLDENQQVIAEFRTE
ncbi:META domain-containing protein [Terricaulis sp.]|uniref:META domain-containing protein n=1 Tax=Terricaulis sp. TaxID=2768686 RepID=UPI003783DCCF